MMQRYAQCVRYLFDNADYSSGGRRYQNPHENWQRFSKLLEKLGQPAASLKVVHVAGTNGKGTATALCSSMLRARGLRVGLFSSPHLHSFRERIRIDDRLVSREAVVSAMEQVAPAVEAVGYASPFEKLTALALVVFRDAAVDWAVLETGLGGRWDATNQCAPAVCGLTRIGLDHMNVLGDTIGAIAAEKGGIIKACAPAFTVAQLSEARAVLDAAAAGAGTSLTECHVEDGVVGELRSACELPGWLAPAHQQLNAALAVAMVRSLDARGLLPPSSQEGPKGHGAADDAGSGTDATCAAGLRAARLPARFEALRPHALADRLLLLDVAHNEPSVAALTASVVAEYGREARVVVIFGANRDKDVPAVLAALGTGLGPTLRAGIAVSSSHPKSLEPSAIVDAAAAAAMAGCGGARVEWAAAETMHQALDLAMAACARAGAGDCVITDDVVLCCGSVFVAASMREAIARAEPELFPPADWVHDAADEPPLVM